nr:putative reverse transcriptase domain-containing protein [Tanacetum cinerariifolium]
MPPRRSEGEELKYPFFEGDGSSFDEWRDYGRNSEAMFPLLEEYFDVFHDELPDALPPLCDIQHHIDLEPSPQLPNRPHYRLCPGEHEELRRQVKEFVSNGHIRKIMSMCAQPRGPLDLMTPQVSSSVPKRVQDCVAGLHDVHKAVRDNLVRANSKYKQDVDQKRRHVEYEVSDFVWVVLTKDRFSVGECNKLSAKKISPLEIVEKMNSNAYHNVGNSRTDFVYPWRNDEGPSIKEQALLFLEAHVKKKA